MCSTEIAHSPKHRHDERTKWLQERFLACRASEIRTSTVFRICCSAVPHVCKPWQSLTSMKHFIYRSSKNDPLHVSHTSRKTSCVTNLRGSANNVRRVAQAVGRHELCNKRTVLRASYGRVRHDGACTKCSRVDHVSQSPASTHFLSPRTNLPKTGCAKCMGTSRLLGQTGLTSLSGKSTSGPSGFSG